MQENRFPSSVDVQGRFGPGSNVLIPMIFSEAAELWDVWGMDCATARVQSTVTCYHKKKKSMVITSAPWNLWKTFMPMMSPPAKSSRMWPLISPLGHTGPRPPLTPPFLIWGMLFENVTQQLVFFAFCS